MGEEKKEEKVEEKAISRRKYLATAGGLAAATAVGWGLAGYALSRPPALAAVRTITETRTMTETKTVTAPFKKSPYEGETIVVAPHAVPHAYAHYRSRDKFKEKTGINVEVVEMVVEEMYEKHMAEFIAKTGAFDVIQFNPAWIADYAEHLEPLVPLAEKEGLWLNVADMIETWRELYCSWEGVQYGMTCDGDTHLYYYRADLFEHPDEMDAFERKYGYKLGPPKTLEQYKDVVEFFTRKKGEKLAGETLNKDFYGVAEYLGRGRMYWWFLWRFGYLGGIYFDEKMNPLIDSDEGIKALKHMIECLPYQPPGALSYTYMEVRTAYVKGDVATCYQWTCVGKAAEDPKESLIVGKTKYDLGPRPMIAGGWVLGIPKSSKKKGAAIYYIDFISSPEQSLWIVKQPDITYDPWRYTHFKDPEFRKAWPRAGEYFDMIIKSVETGFPDLQIPKSAAYMDALDEECCKALAGHKTPEEALRDAAKRWNEITDKAGRDKQEKYWLAQLETIKRLGLLKPKI